MSYRERLQYAPLVATAVMESAAVGQIYEMVTHRTAAGQSVLAWVLIVLALTLWHEYYRVRIPEERLTLWVTRGSLVLDTAVLFTVIYFK